MKNTLEAEIELLLQRFPDLTCEEGDGKFIIQGPYILNREFKDIPLYAEYKIRIEVSFDFPNCFPSVWETSGAIPQEFGHWYSDKSLCLGASCEILDFLLKNPSLLAYYDELLASYFYVAAYYEKYNGETPYGQRSHGVKGKIEAYRDRYHADNDDILIKLLAYIAGISQYRGHNTCDCGSGKRLRDCHGKLVLSDLNSLYYTFLQKDALEILSRILSLKTSDLQKEEFVRAGNLLKR